MKYSIRETLPIVEEVLSEHEAILGASLTGYRNHVYRMVNFGLAFDELSLSQEQELIVAGVFHDLGIWTKKTFDYLGPSIELACRYLESNGRSGEIDRVSRLIDEHHRLRSVGDDRLVEFFRRADIVDLTLGAINYGLDREFVRDVKTRFPNRGFHFGLVKTAGRWVCRHPFDPVPVLKF